MNNNPKVDLKPYRTALEALLTAATPAKLISLLASASSNLDDPKLRDTLKVCIDNVNRVLAFDKNTPLRINHQYLGNIDEVIEYVESVIDENESAWEIIAINNGYVLENEPSDTDLLEWLSHEFERKALCVAESNGANMPSYWVVWDNGTAPQERTISFIVGVKEIDEGSGPAIVDCPLYFFELAPNVKDEEWRNKCKNFHMTNESYVVTEN